MVGLVQDDSFELSLTQVDIGEVTGLTSVHVNRVLRSLRERGLLKLANQRVDILNRKGLAALGDFDPRFYTHRGRTSGAWTLPTRLHLMPCST
jgi:hypothetical protein